MLPGVWAEQLSVLVNLAIVCNKVVGGSFVPGGSVDLMFYAVQTQLNATDRDRVLQLGLSLEVLSNLVIHET